MNADADVDGIADTEQKGPDCFNREKDIIPQS